MAEDEAVFDPTLKKKKKKKKTPFDLDGAIEGHDGEAAVKDEASTTVPAAAAVGAAEDVAAVLDLDLELLGKKKKKASSSKKAKDEGDDDEGGAKGEAGSADAAAADLDMDDLEFGKKKKKKKTRDINLDELEEALPDKDEDEAASADVQEDLDLESFGKKKKKKKRGGEADGNLGPEDGRDPEDDKENEGDSNPWTGSDRDYTYDELLQRVFSIMRDKNPEMVAGDKRFVMKPPQVVRVGTKKTAFVNFAEMAKILHRQPKHLLAFLSAELGTVGAIDGNSQLIMKGRFQQKHIENVLRRYIKEYVTCHTCRSPDTILNKETRLFFLQCMTCHSRCSVQSIKTGFQAVTSKRSVMRAKQ